METTFFAPSDLNQALEVMEKDPEGTMLLAGGTALLWAVKLLGEPVRPRTVISLQNLKGMLGQVKNEPESALEIGSQVSLATLAGETPGGEGVPSILAQAAKSISYPGIRRQATLGGNLANGVMPSQLLPPLASLGATICLMSRGGRRSVDLAQGIAKGTYYPIANSGELITSVSIPRDSVSAPQSYVDFPLPPTDPTVITIVFYEGRLRIALLADGDLSLWVKEVGTEIGGNGLKAKLAEAACLSFGLTDSSTLDPVDVYRRRSMILKSFGLIELS